MKMYEDSWGYFSKKDKVLDDSFNRDLKKLEWLLGCDDITIKEYERIKNKLIEKHSQDYEKEIYNCDYWGYDDSPKEVNRSTEIIEDRNNYTETKYEIVTYDDGTTRRNKVDTKKLTPPSKGNQRKVFILKDWD
ncbi:MAG: hypothetical protein ACOCP8_01400 [archaeon]